MSDPIPIQYPSMVEQSQAMTSVSCGSIIHKNTSHVTLGQQVSKASYVHDTSTGLSTEISREEVVMDPTGDSASIALGVLHDSGGIKTIQPVITTTPASTVVTSLDPSNVYNLTLDGSISWDTNDASLYLSSNKAFRFRYVQSNGISPSRLVLEGLDEGAGVYMPKVEFSTD